jgi:hypothetical protein
MRVAPPAMGLGRAEGVGAWRAGCIARGDLEYSRLGALSSSLLWYSLVSLWVLGSVRSVACGASGGGTGSLSASSCGAWGGGVLVVAGLWSGRSSRGTSGDGGAGAGVGETVALEWHLRRWGGRPWGRWRLRSVASSAAAGDGPLWGLKSLWNRRRWLVRLSRSRGVEESLWSLRRQAPP